MTIEEKYIAATPIEHRKKYAQYFTPKCIAEFMCKWVLNGKQKNCILEPAYGLGIFSRTLAQLSDLQIDAYEIDPEIYSSALPHCPSKVNLSNEDYFSSSWNQKYDAIVCNPPYLKFHDYDNTTYINDVNYHLKTKLNGFTNLYTLFLLKSVYQLKDGGRLAYIIPSEFLNSDYGVEVKRYLIKSNTLQHIIVIDFTECAFNEILTTACILLCEKGNNATVKFSLAKDINELNQSLDTYIEYPTKKLNANEKWKSYYEEGNSKKYTNLIPFSTIAKVSRGIATGANNYFTFNLTKINDYNISKDCFRKCICHSSDVQSLIFTEEDWDNLSQKDKFVYLFNGCINTHEQQVLNYIKEGEQKGINKKYLTANRNPWYALENRAPSPIWVSVFNRTGLKFVRNYADAYNLTTFHCVYNISSIDTDILFAYLITNVAKEIFLDNSRQYANGLVKFEPNDFNKGKILDLRLLNKEERLFILNAYDKLLYSGNSCKKVIAVLNDFFKEKYAKESKATNLNYYHEELKKIVVDYNHKKALSKQSTNNQLTFLNLFEQYDEDNIATSLVCEDNS